MSRNKILQKLLILVPCFFLFAMGMGLVFAQDLPEQQQTVENEKPSTGDVSEEDKSEKAMALTDLLRFMKDSFKGLGAPFMWAILLVAAFAVTIVVDRVNFLYRRCKGSGEELFRRFKILHKDNRIAEVKDYLERKCTPLAMVMLAGLKEPYGSGEEQVQRAMEEAFLGELPKVNRKTQLLATLANLATLLGLLGTIVGLMQAFHAVGKVTASQRTIMLAAGISIAMTTTGLGLLVAIPTLACHGFLNAKAERIVEEMDEISVKMVSYLYHGVK